MNRSLLPHKLQKTASLAADVPSDLASLIRKEIQMAKVEISENLHSLGKNAAIGGIGAVLALFASFFLLLAGAAIIATLIQRTGISPGVSYFLAFTGLAVLLGTAAFLILRKAIAEISTFSLSPQKTIATAKGEEIPIQIRNPAKHEARSRPSSDSLKDEIELQRARLHSETAELKHRLSPIYMVRSCFAGIKHHPLRTLLVGSGTAVGGYLYWRNRHSPDSRHSLPQRKWWHFKHA